MGTVFTLCHCFFSTFYRYLRACVSLRVCAFCVCVCACVSVIERPKLLGEFSEERFVVHLVATVVWL